MDMTTRKIKSTETKWVARNGGTLDMNLGSWGSTPIKHTIYYMNFECAECSYLITLFGESYEAIKTEVETKVCQHGKN